MIQATISYTTLEHLEITSELDAPVSTPSLEFDR